MLQGILLAALLLINIQVVDVKSAHYNGQTVKAVIADNGRMYYIQRQSIVKKGKAVITTSSRCRIINKGRKECVTVPVLQQAGASYTILGNKEVE